MALNITFDGFCSLDDGTMSNSNVFYQAFFYGVNAGSSANKWNAVRTVEASGYWNINLGDGDWLTQTGQAAFGDKIMVVFWRGGDRMGTDCSVLIEWGAFEIVLDSSETYTNPTQVKVNILPELIWTFSTEGLVGVSYPSTNDSHDVHLWDWTGTTMGHYYMWNGEPIFFVNHVNNTSYDWDDGNQDLNLPGSAISSHSWTAPGDYTIEIVIEDECGGTVTGTKDIRIKWPPPGTEIICHQTTVSGGDTVAIPDTWVSFEYTGAYPYNNINSIDWVINDDTDTTTTGVPPNAVVAHTEGDGTSWYGHTATPGAFTDHGTHNVEIVIHWTDGFDTHTITYDEDFYQLLYGGPTPDFTQVPNPVTVGSGVNFNNATTDSESRVGTAGAGEEYDWEWTDDGVLDNVNDVPYSYVYSNTPSSDDISLELCAHWNDGWDDHETCVTKAVAIDTTVIVSQRDCYYELLIYGTSDDGTVSGFYWEVSRSTSSGIAGPWELMWTSPTSMDQREKVICFGEENYFKVQGYATGAGATTSDEEIIFVDAVCPGAECSLIIWNGTGEFDSGGDWDHSGHGSEEDYAKYEGTNGLDATNFSNNKKIRFQDTNENNVDDYDLLSMYINLKEWDADTILYFEDGITVKLSDYLETTNLNQWQRVLIPLEAFGLTAPINLIRLTMESTGNNGFYLDNVEFVVGATIQGVVDVGRPEMEAELQNRPSMAAGEVDFRPSMSAFPPPGNL